MLRYCFFLSLLLISFFPATAQTLNVRVNNIEAVKGNLRVAVYDKADNFRKVEAALSKIQVLVIGNSQVVTFPNIPDGTYAVAVYHDKNSDGKLSTNFVGYPTEGFGFSNNAMGYFGPPSYQSCTFTHSGETTIDIRLRN